MDKSPQALRILIADDHPLFRIGLRKFLEAERDLRVTGEASDGKQTVDLVRELKPDILLLDLAMPRLPGLDALRELAESGTATRTILLTAAAEKEQIVLALQLGARGLVLKDSATELLLKCIRAVMAGHYWIGRESVGSLVESLRALMPQASGEKRKTYGLTPRELEVLGAIVQGNTNKEIARRFSISEETVKHHLTNIFDKVGVSNRLELALFALQKGLIREI